MLKGNIKAYSEDARAGVIIGLTGKPYGFYAASRAGPFVPQAGECVIFQANGRDAWNVSSAEMTR